LASANPYAWIPFAKRMAKIPTVSVWSTGTGAANNVRDLNAGVDRAVTAINATVESGFSGVNITGANAAATNYAFHYTADTGW
jgi:hypothetical protein